MNQLLAENRILIVDDNPETIQVLSVLLKGEGELIFATSGQQALGMAERYLPHLILLDRQMPGMDGYETCRALKANPLTRGSAVIFITAHSSEETELFAFEAGAVDYITKPFNAAVVRARVRTHLSLKQHADALQRLANRDGLTGVHNRRYLDLQLESEFQRHLRQGLSLGLALFDLDHFKRYNDSYGHQAGDECLRVISRSVDDLIRRPGEIIARYGGEEFAIILPHTGRTEAERFGSWLCEQVRQTSIPLGRGVTGPGVTISVGVAFCVPHSRMTTRDLIRGADTALYESKARGRDCVTVTDLTAAADPLAG